MASVIQVIIETIVEFQKTSKHICPTCGSPWQVFEIDPYDLDDDNITESIKFAHKILKRLDVRTQDLNDQTVQMIIEDIKRDFR